MPGQWGDRLPGRGAGRPAQNKPPLLPYSGAGRGNFRRRLRRRYYILTKTNYPRLFISFSLSFWYMICVDTCSRSRLFLHFSRAQNKPPLLHYSGAGRGNFRRRLRRRYYILTKTNYPRLFISFSLSFWYMICVDTCSRSRLFLHFSRAQNKPPLLHYSGAGRGNFRRRLRRRYYILTKTNYPRLFISFSLSFWYMICVDTCSRSRPFLHFSPSLTRTGYTNTHTTFTL